MSDPSAVVMPEWVVWAGGIAGTAIAAAIARLASKAGTSDKAQQDKISMVAAIQPTADRLTNDVLITTLNEMKHVLLRLNERMDEQDRERRDDERDEYRELKAELKELERQLRIHGSEYRLPPRSPRRD